MGKLIEKWSELESFLTGEFNHGLNGHGKSIVLFGAGLQGSFAADYMAKTNRNLYFSDNNPALWGTEKEGHKIISPNEIKSLTQPQVFITALPKLCKQIKGQLDELGIDSVSFAGYIYARNIDKLRYIYDECLTDDESKRIYLNVIWGKVNSGTAAPYDDICADKQYFAIPPFNSNHDIMVDCGAFVGDTLENFIWFHQGNFKKIYAFEPSQKLFHALQIRAARLKGEWALTEGQICLENCAVGEMNGQLALEQTDIPSVSRISMHVNTKQNGPMTKVWALDEYFQDCKDCISMIKADIEGFELAMLKGAKNLILTSKPNLAICIYHRAEDMFEIANYLKELVPEYKMAVRHHSFRDVETVLYCYL